MLRTARLADKRAALAADAPPVPVAAPVAPAPALVATTADDPVRGRNACEACGSFTGDEHYWSADDCNETGHGVVLCEPCARGGITGALLAACADEGPCPECHRVGAHEGICAGPAPAPIGVNESGWLASYIAALLDPETTDERDLDDGAHEYRDRGPATVIYHYDASGFVLRLGACEYAITVTRVAR